MLKFFLYKDGSIIQVFFKNRISYLIAANFLSSHKSHDLFSHYLFFCTEGKKFALRFLLFSLFFSILRYFFSLSLPHHLYFLCSYCSSIILPTPLLHYRVIMRILLLFNTISQMI